MRSAKAVFVKQMRDLFKNREILIQYILFPVMAFVMTELVVKPNEEMPGNIFILMFAAMFLGMAPLTSTANAIAEDRERKSLRFLVMAGVKPHAYMLGVGGFTLLVCTFVAVAFGLIGGFAGVELLKFILIMMFGAVISILLGATIGILSKSQQKSTSIAIPVALLLTFVPFLAEFNETLKSVSFFIFTGQIDTILRDFSVFTPQPYLIVLANGIVFAALFALVFKKKGLKG
jgi:ABC-2 type transport system permease protein